MNLDSILNSSESSFYSAVSESPTTSSCEVSPIDNKYENKNQKALQSLLISPAQSTNPSQVHLSAQGQMPSPIKSPNYLQRNAWAYLGIPSQQRQMMMKKRRLGHGFPTNNLKLSQLPASIATNPNIFYQNGTFKCMILNCPYSFQTKKALKAHIKVSHHDSELSVNNMNPKPTEQALITPRPSPNMIANNIGFKQVPMIKISQTELNELSKSYASPGSSDSNSTSPSKSTSEFSHVQKMTKNYKDALELLAIRERGQKRS